MIGIFILCVLVLVIVAAIGAILLAQQARPCPRRPKGTTTTDFKEQG